MSLNLGHFSVHLLHFCHSFIFATFHLLHFRHSFIFATCQLLHFRHSFIFATFEIALQLPSLLVICLAVRWHCLCRRRCICMDNVFVSVFVVTARSITFKFALLAGLALLSDYTVRQSAVRFSSLVVFLLLELSAWML